MADDSDQLTLFDLSLDDKGFTSTLLKAQAQLDGFASKAESSTKGIDDNFKDLASSVEDWQSKFSSLGESSLKDLAKMTSGLSGVGIALAAVSVAALALKVSFDEALDAEKIDAAEKRFNSLADVAGVSAAKIKTGMDEASKGLISTEQSTELASQAILRLGKNADQIPAIMQVALNATRNFGGTLQGNFESISSAIANNNVRMLKQFGLIVDADKAYQSYAASIGTTKDRLSEAGKQAAFVNAVLDESAKKYGQSNQSLTPMADGLQRLKVAFSEVADAIASTFLPLSTKFGAALDWLAEKTKSFATSISENLGHGADRANLLTTEIEKFQSRIDELTKNPNPANNTILDFYTKKLAAAKAELSEIEAKTPKTTGQPVGVGVGGGLTPDDAIAAKTQEQLEKELQVRAKFEAELSQMRDQRVNQEIQLAATEDSLDKAQAERRVILAQQTQAKIDQINANKDLNQSQKNQLIEAAEAAHQEKLLEIDRKADQERQEMLNNQQKNSKSLFDGIGNAAKASLNKQQTEFKTAGGVGATAFKGLESIGVGAFQALGAGAAGGAKQMEAAMLSSLGNVASSQGKIMLLGSLWPVFRPEIAAAGAALMALGSFLGSASSGGSSATTSSGATASSDTAAAPAAVQTAAPQAEQKKHSVSVVVQGSIYETEQTKQRLLEMIRDATDATDFKYQQIGGS